MALCYGRSYRLTQGLTGPHLGSDHVGSSLASATYWLWNLVQLTLTFEACDYLSLQDGVTIKSTLWSRSKYEQYIQGGSQLLTQSQTPNINKSDKKNKQKTPLKIIFITNRLNTSWSLVNLKMFAIFISNKIFKTSGVRC